jgi:hypothetical protein
LIENLTKCWHRLEAARLDLARTEVGEMKRRAEWRRTPETVLQKAIDEIAAHLNLVEQAAAIYKTPGSVQ